MTLVEECALTSDTPPYDHQAQHWDYDKGAGYAVLPPLASRNATIELKVLPPAASRDATLERMIGDLDDLDYLASRLPPSASRLPSAASRTLSPDFYSARSFSDVLMRKSPVVFDYTTAPFATPVLSKRTPAIAHRVDQPLKRQRLGAVPLLSAEAFGTIPTYEMIDAMTCEDALEFCASAHKESGSCALGKRDRELSVQNHAEEMARIMNERMQLNNRKLVARPDLPKACIKRIMAQEACVNTKVSSAGSHAVTSVIIEMFCMRLTRLAWASFHAPRKGKGTLQPSHFIQVIQSMPEMDFLTDVVDDFIEANPDHL